MQHMSPYFIMGLMRRQDRIQKIIFEELSSYDNRNTELISWKK